MTYAFVWDVAIDETLYGEIRAALGAETPKGLIVHLVLRQEHGLRYLDVWDSEDDWVRFRDDRLGAAVEWMETTYAVTPPATQSSERPIDVIHTWVGATSQSVGIFD